MIIVKQPIILLSVQMCLRLDIICCVLTHAQKKCETCSRFHSFTIPYKTKYLVKSPLEISGDNSGQINALSSNPIQILIIFSYSNNHDHEAITLVTFYTGKYAKKHKVGNKMVIQSIDELLCIDNDSHKLCKWVETYDCQAEYLPSYRSGTMMNRASCKSPLQSGIRCVG